MRLLTDKQLKELIPYVGQKDFPEDKKPLVSGRRREQDYKANESAVQGCSLDLHIDEIREPESYAEIAKASAAAGTGGELSMPPGRKHYDLAPGRTVVVTTQETLCVPKNYAVIAFPPMRLSIKGILTTNPGHIDPGYEGKMHITMINMGGQTVPLERGQVVVTLLVFELDEQVAAGYHDRIKDRPDYLVDALTSVSADFLDIEERAERVAREIAAREINKARDAITGQAVLISVAAILVSVLLFAFNFAILTGLSDVRADVAALKEHVPELERVSVGN